MTRPAPIGREAQDRLLRRLHANETPLDTREIIRVPLRGGGSATFRYDGTLVARVRLARRAVGLPVFPR